MLKFKRLKASLYHPVPVAQRMDNIIQLLSNWDLDKTNDRIRKNDSASHNRMEKASHEGNVFYLEQYQIMVYQWSLLLKDVFHRRRQPQRKRQF